MGLPQILWGPLGSSGALWGPLGGSHRVPEEELKSEFNRKVARNNSLSNFPENARVGENNPIRKCKKNFFLQNSPRKMATIKNPHSHICLEMIKISGAFGFSPAQTCGLNSVWSWSSNFYLADDEKHKYHGWWFKPILAMPVFWKRTFLKSTSKCDRMI